MAIQLIQLVSTAMDVAIVILLLAFIYLFITRMLLSKPLPQKVQRAVQQPRPSYSEEEETLKMISEEKGVQAALLGEENAKLEAAVRKAKVDFTGRRISATSYRNMVEEAKEKLAQNKARIKLLTR